MKEEFVVKAVMPCGDGYNCHVHLVHDQDDRDCCNMQGPCWHGVQVGSVVQITITPPAEPEGGE